MMPVLYTIGSFNVYAFGFFLALAFLLSTFVVWQKAKEEFKEEEYLDAYLYGFMSAVILGRAVYIMRNFSDFGFYLLQYILVTKTPGLSMMGAMAGGVLFLAYYSHKKKLPFFHLTDIFSLAGSLAMVFIKFGQQLSGAAFGKETGFFLKIRIANLPGLRHPAEFYEAILFLVSFLFLTYLYKRGVRQKWSDGIISGVFGILLSLNVFVLEFLKVYRVYLYGLSFRHILSLGLFLTSSSFLLYKLNVIKKFRKKT